MSSGCKKCGGFITQEYEDAWCLNCGWRDNARTGRVFTVRNTSNGQERHYDPDDSVDKRIIANFLKKCPGSDKVAYLMGSRVRCNYCHKVTLENKKGKASDHTPAIWFAERIKEVVAVKAAEFTKG